MKSIRPVVFLALSLALLLVSCSGGPRVIPRKTLAEIYAEMFVTDEWLQDNRSKVNRLADTSFVYAPILDKYGYDADDYLLSVEKYLADPERFSRILRDTEAKLKTRAEELKKVKSDRERLRRLELRRDSIVRVWSISLDSMNKAFVVPVESDTVIFELLSDSTSLKAFPNPVGCSPLLDSATFIAFSDTTSAVLLDTLALGTASAADSSVRASTVDSIGTASAVDSVGLDSDSVKDTAEMEKRDVVVYKKMF